MPTVVTITVGPSGRDYTTIQAAVTNAPLIASGVDFVTNDEQVRLVVDQATYAESVTINLGLTTDSTRNLVIVPASGSEHLGIYGDGVIVEPTAGGHAFEVYDSWVHIDGLEIHTGTGTSDEGVRLRDGCEGNRITHCLFDGVRAGSQGDGVYAGNWDVGENGNPIFIGDCSFINCERGGVHAQAFSGTSFQSLHVYNCDFMDCGGGVRVDAANVATVIELEIVNCWTSNCSRDLEIDGGSAGTVDTTGSSNNLSSDSNAAERFPSSTFCGVLEAADAPFGTGNWIGIADKATTVAAGFDLTPVDDPDNNILGGGVGPASNSLVLTTDIAGNTRSGATCDVGPYDLTSELAAPSGETASGAPSLAGPTASGTGTLAEPTGSGAACLSGPAASGAGSSPVTGAGAAALSGPGASGSVTAPIESVKPGTSLSGPGASGAGAMAVEGAGAVALAGPTATGASSTPATSAGAPALAGPSASGSAAAALEASGAASLAGPTATGAAPADDTEEAAGAAALAGPTASGAAMLALTAAGAAALSGPTAKGYDQLPWYDRQVATTPAVPGSWGEMIRRNHLLTTWLYEILREANE